MGFIDSNGGIKIYNIWCINFIIYFIIVWYFSKFDIDIYGIFFFLKIYYYFNFYRIFFFIKKLFMYLLIVL